MPGYEFHLSHIFTYNDRIVHSVLIRKYTDQNKKLGFSGSSNDVCDQKYVNLNSFLET